MKNASIYSFLFIVLIGCNDKNTATEQSKEPVIQPEVVITAARETAAVRAETDDDAADDPAFWYNFNDPTQSLIIGTNKKSGLQVYNLNGELTSSYPVGRVNNADVRQGVQDSFDLVGASNRDNLSMDFWLVDKASRNLMYAGEIVTELTDVYGFCLSIDPTTKTAFAFVNSKTGKIEQWKLSISGDKVTGTLVRTLQLQSQVEGMVADDELGKLYVGEEARGVYRFDLSETGSDKGTLIALSDESNPDIKYDIEGVTIYETSKTEGYLIASSQGNNSYAVFERSGKNRYIGSFNIEDGVVDGVQETDGIHAVSVPLGEAFPKGMFICQDGFNYNNQIKVSQNFKMVSWVLIAEKLGLE